MNISPINYQVKTNNSPAFKANLWIEKSVQEVISPRRGIFLDAAKRFDGWLQNEQRNVHKTLTIRKNTSLIPKVAIEKEENRLKHSYPHEVTGYYVLERIKKYEDLEFELGGKKCGFWYDPASNVEKLFTDFKKMFDHLQKD